MHEKIKSGFTLIELLLVIGIIAILSGIVIIAIDPARQIAQARNAQRASDIKTISNAIQQYYIENERWPGGDLSSEFKEICATGDATSTHNLDCSGGVDLSILVPDYVPAVPQDTFTIGTSSRYAISLVDNDLQLVALESQIENLPVVVIGTTTEAASQIILTLNPGGGTTSGGNDPGVIDPPSGNFCIATGGSVITDGDYKVHTFTYTGSTSTFEVTAGICNSELLIVAGGGAGSSAAPGFAGGGGGAGGVAEFSNIPLQTANYDVIVGAGGAPTASGDLYGNSGQNSSISGGPFTYETFGGGGGGRYNGLGGGSGGGAGGHDSTNFKYGGSGYYDVDLSIIQGYSGGNGVYTSSAGWPSRSGGGGGGAGAAGQHGSQNVGGKGGDGIQSDISGVLSWYGGGGGGADANGAAGGLGGLGGGGDAILYSIGNNAENNTGGGGGGGASGYLGGYGGRGIVIIRYQYQ